LALQQVDKHLIDVFCSNVSIAFENALLHKDIESTQAEAIYLLGEAVENRSLETGNHVKRVAELTEFLALKFGLDEVTANKMKLTSPLHDLGKIGIPDSILNKPGRHTQEEREIMKGHVNIGHKMLSKSNRELLKYAAIIANRHHEHWDGNGYPAGLQGEDIHIAGRITAITDVVDALANKRCYKDVWPLEKVIALLEEQRGKHFDPQLVDLILNNWGEVIKIQMQYQDE
jgi:response regulator RpfG family c-di-GMP phosphodiesterase